MAKDKQEDILIQIKKDRRILAHVPDPQSIRTTTDRRGSKEQDNTDVETTAFLTKMGLRYQADFPVIVKYQKQTLKMQASDISMTGILVSSETTMEMPSKEVYLEFEIPPSTMPEGYEMKVKIKANVVRMFTKENIQYYGFEFIENLYSFSRKRKQRYTIMVSSILLFIITMFIVLMRAESIIYFKFNKWLYLYSIIAAVFLLSRYFFGAFYRPISIKQEFTPGVSIIIPCFNEEEWIQKTITSCLNQNYPTDKLEVIVVDDCSNDRSVEQIKELFNKIKQNDRYQVLDRLHFIQQESNKGKREALALGVQKAKHELVVFVDSDSFLDPFAIYNIVQPFQDPKMGGVSGRCDVANIYTNVLTKMQTVRYYIAFRIMKAAEAYFDAVTCLSGPLSCYRKDIVLDNMEEWLNQSFLGQKATFGDDRAMTNFVLEHHRTYYQDTAICSTIVPNTYKVFLKQQMRWKRSWLRESLLAGMFMWKKEPFMAVLFYIGVIVPLVAPAVVLYNLIYVPIVYHVFPSTFLIGILMMSLLMAVAQLFLKRSTTWIFGLVFCFYYEAVLLWQMPIAWVTFWKSTWGTRMTVNDVEEQNRKEEKQRQRQQRGKYKNDIYSNK